MTIRIAWESIKADRVLGLTLIGQVFVWTIATLLPPPIMAYDAAQLGLLDWQAGLPLAAPWDRRRHRLPAGRQALRRQGRIRLAPLGRARPDAQHPGLRADRPRPRRHDHSSLSLLGIFSGFLFVPLNALLQWRSPADRRGAIIAVANVLVYGGMLSARSWPGFWPEAGVDARGTFLGASIVLGCGFLWALSLVPDAFFRFLMVGLAHTIYRVRVVGRSNVPAEGGALLVPNHVTFADGLFIITSDRPAGSVHGLPRVLRQAVHRLGPAVDEGDPDLLERRPEDDPASVSRGRQGARRRRHRLHLSRGPAHPHRLDGAVSARAFSASSRAAPRRSSRCISTA